MKTPDPTPLKAALDRFHKQRAEIAALHAKATEVRAQLGDTDPLDDSSMTVATVRQTQLDLIPARIAKLGASMEERAAAVVAAIDVFHRELRDMADAEREQKTARIEAILKPYFSDRVGSAGSNVNQAREIAKQADQLQTIPFQVVGKLTVSGQSRSNDPARFDQQAEERAEELLAIFEAWNKAGRQFGGGVK